MNEMEYFLPQSISEATQILAEYGSSVLIKAGGTIAMPLINEGISFPENLMGLRRAGLDYVTGENGTKKIGAAATFTDIMDKIDMPLLKQAAHSIGGWAIRNMGTAGGNLFAPPPAGDFAAALLALDASIKVASTEGERVIGMEDFYTGFLTNSLSPDELVVEFQVPQAFGKTAFMKYGRKHANTPAVVTVAAQIAFDGQAVSQARIVLNAVGPYPQRAARAEEALIGNPLDTDAIEAAASAASAECKPFTDAIASEWYRRKMVGVYVRRTLSMING